MPTENMFARVAIKVNLYKKFHALHYYIGKMISLSILERKTWKLMADSTFMPTFKKKIEMRLSNINELNSS